MPTSKRTTKSPSTRKRNSRTTVGGPSDPQPTPIGRDDLAAKAAGTAELAAQMPFNATKTSEYDLASDALPPEDQQAKPADPLVGASPVTEMCPSDKAGSGAPPNGDNKTIGTLDRVRVDSTAQRLTTNQGVPIADNQSSLKAGLRGPTLLEDFILREKITHFDH